MTPPLRIVYAEDCAQDADLTREHFAEHAPDFDLQVVATGEACLEAVARTHPDLVLLDHHLPDTEGLDVLRALTRAAQPVPVVLVTGAGDEELVVQALRLGAAYYVAKSGDYLRDLPELLRGVLAEHRVERARCPVAEGPWRVLYVEHLAMDIELTQRHFADAAPRFELEVVRSAAEALERLERPPAPDAALIDLRLPGQNGLDLVREARQRRLPLPPFVIISGKGDEAAAMATLRLGAADYLTKRNGYLDRLVHTVERVIAHARLDRLNARLQTELDERRRVEAELDFQRTLLESQSEASVDGILTVDASGRVLWHNRRFQQMWGIPAEVMQTREEAVILDHITAIVLDAGSFLAEIRRLGAEWTQRSRDEVRLADGRTFDRHSAPVVDARGASLGRVWVFRDVTRERRLQAGAAQSDRLASMGLVAASVAHEINNPLSYVLHCLESLAEELPSLFDAMRRCHDTLLDRAGPDTVTLALGEPEWRFDPERLEDVLAQVAQARSGTERIADIVRGVGALSRVDQTELVATDIRVGIEHAITVAHNEIRHRARLVQELSPVPPVLASDGKLAQVFLNLLVNAAHAIEAGDLEHNEIRVRTWSDGDDVFAAVSDTGRGVSPEQQGHIFEPFFSTKPAGMGTGLGLSICRDIVAGFGGGLTFESAVGQGARFQVRLPRAAERLTPAPTTAPAERPAARPSVRGRILVIDDDEGVRAIMTRILEPQHEVVAEASGEGARARLARDRRFDAVFCDLMMPGTSGMDLHAWLVEADPSIAQRVVFVTGGTFTSGAAAYVARVRNRRIDKPFSASSLRDLADELVVAARAPKSG